MGKDIIEEDILKNSLTQECGGKGTAMDKSVLLWKQKAFGYNYGAGFRNKDPVNLSNNEFMVNECFETEEKEESSESSLYTNKKY